MFFCTRRPVVRIRQQFIGDPVVVFTPIRRVDDTGDMTGSTEDKTYRTRKKLSACIGRFPGCDMVLYRGNETSGHVDGGEIDGCTGYCQLRFAQAVVKVHIAQIPTVHFRRHAGGIRIPVEKIEWTRIVSEQIIIDVKRPDKVIRPHHVEGTCHRGALKKTLFIHPLFETADLLFIDENPKLSRFGKIDHGGEIGCTPDAAVTFSFHIGQSGAQQGTTETVANGVEFVLSGNLLDHVRGYKNSLFKIGVESDVTITLIWIYPRDDKDRVPLLNKPSEHRIFRLQVHDIKLVDPGRNHQQRSLEYLFRGGRVLDKLEHAVLKNHLSRRHRHVPAQFKSLRIGHPYLQLPLSILQILQHVFQTVNQAASLGLDYLLQYRWIGGGKIGW